MSLSQSSETPLDKKIEKEEKIVKPKTNNYKDKKVSIYKNKNKKKSKRNYFFQNKKPKSDSKIKIYSKHLENLKDKNENIKMYIDEEINGFSYDLALQYGRNNS